MSRSLSRFQAVLLSLIVLMGLSLAAGGLFLIGDRGWYGADAFHVRAAFQEIRGVEVGTRVRLKGIDAGEVTAVLPPRQLDAPVVLRLRLKGEFRRLVRPDSVVRIESDGFVGGKVLEINAGGSTHGLDRQHLCGGRSAACRRFQRPDGKCGHCLERRPRRAKVRWASSLRIRRRMIPLWA